jgi:hypothetical protein
VTVNIFTEELNAFLNDPSGPVADELERVAHAIVVPDAVEALSVPGTRLGGSWEGNPAPGPPRRRSGDLVASLEVLPAVLSANLTGDVGLAVHVAADPAHQGFAYGRHLLNQGYAFLPERDYYRSDI